MRYTGNAASDAGSTFPEGDYFLKCTGVTDKEKDGVTPLKSKKSGNDMWILEMTVAEGEFEGRKLWNYLTWIPAGAPGHGMTLKTLKSFGINPEGENDIEPHHLKDVIVKCKVKIEKSEGYDPKNAIARWYTPEGVEGVRHAPVEDAAGTAQAPGDASFNPEELEKQLADKKTPPPAKPAGSPWGPKK